MCYMYVWLCMEELVAEVKLLLQQLEVESYAHKKQKVSFKHAYAFL